MLMLAERSRRSRSSAFLLVALAFATLNTVVVLWVYSARSSDPSASIRQRHAAMFSPSDLEDRGAEDDPEDFVETHQLKPDADLPMEAVSDAASDQHRELKSADRDNDAVQPASSDNKRKDARPLPKWIADYIEFHRRPSTNQTRYLIWTCSDAIPCGGIGDRARGIVTSFYLALITRRKLLILNPDPVDITDVLRPASFDWATEAASLAPLASWEYQSVDHINEALFDFVLSESRRHRVVAVRSNYIIWPTIMNDVRLTEPRNNLMLPHGDSSKAWTEMLFSWAWRALMVPSDALRNDIAAVRQLAGLQNDFIAVHIRRGGHWGDPLRYNGEGLLQNFAGCLQNMTVITGKLPVYVTSDDVAAKEEFARIALDQQVVYDNTTQPFHVERTERNQGFVERNRRAWAEYYLLSQSRCAIACGSGFSIWPVAMTRDLATGSRCFARFERCSVENIQRSLHEFFPVRI